MNHPALRMYRRNAIVRTNRQIEGPDPRVRRITANVFDRSIAGLPKPAHALEGTSFKSLLEDPDRKWKSAAFSEYKREGYHGRTLREKRYRYTEWTPLPGTDGETMRELYDLVKDPFEYDNLAVTGAHDALIAELSRRLEAGWRAALP